ncbi:MAG: archease [Candidatus Nanoarchaeia archaeon]
MAVKEKSTLREKYRFLENLVTADIAFEAFGKNLNELFTNSAMALTTTMADLKTISPKTKKIIKLQNTDLSALLIDFLNEIVYYKDAEALIFSKFKITIKQENKLWKLIAELVGENINWKKHKLKADVKAATWHLFDIQERKGKGWRAQIVLDI